MYEVGRAGRFPMVQADVIEQEYAVGGQVQLVVAQYPVVERETDPEGPGIGQVEFGP